MAVPEKNIGLLSRGNAPGEGIRWTGTIRCRDDEPDSDCGCNNKPAAVVEIFHTEDYFYNNSLILMMNIPRADCLIGIKSGHIHSGLPGANGC